MQSSQLRAWSAAGSPDETMSLGLLPSANSHTSGIFLLLASDPRRSGQREAMPGPSLKTQSCHRDPGSSQRPQNRADLQVPSQGHGTEGPNKDRSGEGRGVHVLSLLLEESCLCTGPDGLSAHTGPLFPRRKSFQFPLYSWSPIKVSKGPGTGPLWKGRSLEPRFQYTSQQA